MDSNFAFALQMGETHRLIQWTHIVGIWIQLDLLLIEDGSLEVEFAFQAFRLSRWKWQSLESDSSLVLSLLLSRGKEILVQIIKVVFNYHSQRRGTSNKGNRQSDSKDKRVSAPLWWQPTRSWPASRSIITESYILFPSTGPHRTGRAIHRCCSLFRARRWTSPHKIYGYSCLRAHTTLLDIFGDMAALTGIIGMVQGMPQHLACTQHNPPLHGPQTQGPLCMRQRHFVNVFYHFLPFLQKSTSDRLGCMYDDRTERIRKLRDFHNFSILASLSAFLGWPFHACRHAVES